MAQARSLVARFSADTSAFRSELTSARAFSANQFSLIARAGTSAFSQIGSSAAGSMASTGVSVARAALALNSAFKLATAAAGLFTAAAAAGAVELARFSQIAERARAADVGTTYFQSFTVAARAFRGEVSALRDDLAGISKATRDTFDGDRASGVSNRAREMLIERFRGTNEFGISNAPALFDQARNSEERIRAVLVGLRDMEAAGRQLAAIDMAERLGMRNLAEQVNLGKTSFAGFLVEVDKLRQSGLSDGSIVSPEMITRAEELRKRFADVGSELGRNMRPILDECARLALMIGNGAAWSAEQFAALIGVIGRVVAALRNATVEANALQGSAARLARIQVTTTPDASDGPGQAQAAREAAARRSQRGTTGQADRLQAENDSEATREAARARGLGALEPRLAGANFSAPVPDPRPVVAPAPSTPAAGAKATDDWAEAYKRLIESMEKANGVARAELATIGLSTAERERATAIAKAEAEARKNGKTLTDEQRSAVGRLADEHGRLRDAIKNAEQAQKGLSDALQWTGDQIVDMIANGRSLNDVMKALSGQAIRAAITGQGPFAQLLGFAPQASAPSGTLGGLMGMFQQQQFQPQQIAAPMMAGMGQVAQGMQPLMLNSFGQVATETRGQFGTVFTGLGGLLQMVLTQAITSAQGAGGLGGILGAFGGGANSGPLNLAGGLSPFALYSSGGYTGPGGVDQTAGIVHKGEVVWSQRDVARAGGVGVVEAMRRGMRGYASGGPVGYEASADKAASMTSALIAWEMPALKVPAAAIDTVRQSGGAGGGAPRITINNHGPTKPQVSRNSDGSLEVLIPAIEGALADRVSRREGSLWSAQTAVSGAPATGALRG